MKRIFKTLGPSKQKHESTSDVVLESSEKPKKTTRKRNSLPNEDREMAYAAEEPRSACHRRDCLQKAGQGDEATVCSLVRDTAGGDVAGKAVSASSSFGDFDKPILGENWSLLDDIISHFEQKEDGQELSRILCKERDCENMTKMMDEQLSKIQRNLRLVGRELSDAQSCYISCLDNLHGNVQHEYSGLKEKSQVESENSDEEESEEESEDTSRSENENEGIRNDSLPKEHTREHSEERGEQLSVQRYRDCVQRSSRTAKTEDKNVTDKQELTGEEKTNSQSDCENDGEEGGGEESKVASFYDWYDREYRMCKERGEILHRQVQESAARVAQLVNSVYKQTNSHAPPHP